MATQRFRDSQSREAFWREVIEGWPTSGLTQAAYCRKHEVSVWSFHAWRKRLKQPATSVAPDTAFVPVHVVSPADAMEVVLTNGRVMRVPYGWDAEVVGRMATALEPTAC